MQSPHDRLFRAAFRSTEHVRQWLRWLLPPILVDAVLWETLRQASESVQGHALRVGTTDGLFVVTLRTSAPLFLILEHKRRGDFGLRRQILDYCTHVGHQARAGRGAPPALVLAVVLHHGLRPLAESAPHPHLLGLPAATASLLASCQPTVQFLLDDLTASHEQAILERPLTPLVRLACVALRCLPDASPMAVLAAFRRWERVLREVDRGDDPPGNQAIEAVSCYALAVSDVAAEDLRALLEHILERPEETLMSTLERLRQQAKADGITLGEARGEAKGEARRIASLRSVLERQLTRRFGPLPATADARLVAADAATLERWLDRVLDVATLEQIFSD